MDQIQPGDIRVDKSIPTRCLYIVRAADYVPHKDGEEWWETNLGCIEKQRIGSLLDHEDPANWDWVNRHAPVADHQAQATNSD